MRDPNFKSGYSFVEFSLLHFDTSFSSDRDYKLTTFDIDFWETVQIQKLQMKKKEKKITQV